MSPPVMQTHLEGLTLLGRGKVRDVYDLGDTLLIVASDRLSAFDVVMPTPIPDKGRILTGLSAFWFRFTRPLVRHHVISTEVSEFPQELQRHAEVLRGRSMLVQKADVVPIECVVRGYLAGSGWKEYQKSGTICGAKLPAGLVESDKLPSPMFTPATKAASGHDENISVERMYDIVGKEIGAQLADLSVHIYEKASEYAREKGVIISDTKFEFGLLDGRLMIVDEMLTPDSSRFWDADDYAPGRSQKSFDKQFVRDYLETLDWNKEPPGPELPADIVEKTREKYLQAYRRILGGELT